MQIVSLGDNLHEMSKPVFWEKYEKRFQTSSVESFTIHSTLYSIQRFSEQSVEVILDIKIILNVKVILDCLNVYADTTCHSTHLG